MAQNVLLGAAVKGDDMQAVAALDLAEPPIPLVLVPGICLGGHDSFYPVGTRHRGAISRSLYQGSIVGFSTCKNSAHRAADPQASRQGSCIDPFDTGNFVLLQIFIEADVRPPVGIGGGKFAHDKAGDVRPTALDILAVDTVIADQRIGHRDDLALVRRISQDFLVAGHGGVENDFAFGVAGESERPAGEDRSIFQRQPGGTAGSAH